jgi:hypothetical protein
MMMALTQSDRNRIRKIIQLAEDILEDNAGSAERRPRRIRRSGKELTAFRKMLLNERKRGIPVAELARKHGITTAYIYQLK